MTLATSDLVMDKRRRTTKAATVAVVALVTALVTGSLIPATAGDGGTCYTWSRHERGFARKINGARANADLGRLRIDPELSKVAMKHTRLMTAENELVHTSSDALRRRVTNWLILGENVGVGATVGSLHTAFLASPAHRANVLHSSFNYVGVGVKRAAGRMWVTIVFEGTKNPGTNLTMPSC